MIRYNILTKFFVEKENLIITNPTHNTKIKMIYNKTYYDFFVYCERKIFINNSDINKFNIKEKFIKILIHHNFFTKEKNTGIEYLFFSEIEANPSKILVQLSEEETHRLYRNVEKGIEKSLKNFYNPIKKNIKEPIININNNTLNQLHSKRLTEETSEYNKENILGIIKLIFSKRKQEQIFNINRSFFKYGSGGGLYTIYPILITKHDEIIIYEHFKGKFFEQKKVGIYNTIKEGLISSGSVNFNAYNYILLLASDYKKVFYKYGNRGYKLLLLECGEISYMFRMILGEKNKPHVEIQGYYDKIIQQTIYDLGIKLLPLHILAISD